MCPFIDRTDSRCAEQLTFRNVFMAFAHCADHYCACPIYQKLLTEGRGHARNKGLNELLAAS